MNGSGTLRIVVPAGIWQIATSPLPLFGIWLLLYRLAAISIAGQYCAKSRDFSQSVMKPLKMPRSDENWDYVNRHSPSMLPLELKD